MVFSLFTNYSISNGWYNNHEWQNYSSRLVSGVSSCPWQLGCIEHRLFSFFLFSIGLFPLLWESGHQRVVQFWLLPLVLLLLYLFIFLYLIVFLTTITTSTITITFPTATSTAATRPILNLYNFLFIISTVIVIFTELLNFSLICVLVALYLLVPINYT